MEQVTTNEHPRDSDYQELGGKAWTAYAITVTFGVFVMLIAVSVGHLFFPTVGYFFMALILAHTVYRVLVLRSFNLYTDQNGIWIYSGILPWTRGIRGVKWRDLDEAVYFTTMFSWAFRSYTIRLGHRYTKSSEIYLSHWASGDKIVAKINDAHADLVRSRALH